MKSPRQPRAMIVACALFANIMINAEASIASKSASVDLKTVSSSKMVSSTYEEDAELLRQTFEEKLFTFSAFKRGHYGLRMYRQTQDSMYEASVWSDMARVASRLNRFATEVHTPEQIAAYSAGRLSRYGDKEGERSELRYEATKKYPEYFYLGVDLLGSMARANEYGLKHREDVRLRKVIRRYDFAEFATDPEMIRAWAAQIANQVYWLQQLGEQDVVEEFISAFRKTYPDSQDHQLTDQQFMNKIYGLTHIIFAASGYYQYSLDEADFQWIYDYYRKNIDEILRRSKEDVVAEVGINFLLVGLEDDPVVEKTRKAIQQSINREAGMIPSVTGSTDLESGEHRNVLAIMLLDWQGVNNVPTADKQPEIFDNVPYGLIESI